VRVDNSCVANYVKVNIEQLIKVIKIKTEIDSKKLIQNFNFSLTDRLFSIENPKYFQK
jgi:hypothetical protein